MIKRILSPFTFDINKRPLLKLVFILFISVKFNKLISIPLMIYFLRVTFIDVFIRSGKEDNHIMQAITVYLNEPSV